MVSVSASGFLRLSQNEHVRLALRPGEVCMDVRIVLVGVCLVRQGSTCGSFFFLYEGVTCGSKHLVW